jgi:ankyrin repeat protein
MTKESALYRTVEIKMKMKQKLKSIEDILFFLIEENNKIEFQTLIEKYCVDIDIRDKKLNTFIIRAVQTDNIEIVNYLIEKGAKLNLQNNYGNTALHYAILNKNFKIVDLLIKNGANEEIKNKFGFTPYELNNIPFQYSYKNEDDEFFNSEDENNLKNDKE